MDLLTKARQQRRLREALTGRPIVLAATRTLQRRLDRFWPGVVLAFNPSLKQFILQDRRSPCSKSWYAISVMEPGEWPSFQGLMKHLESISIGDLQTSWDVKRWYQETFIDPEDQLIEMNRQSFENAALREIAKRMASVMEPRTVVQFGGER